jgi:spore germination protein GerM
MRCARVCARLCAMTCALGLVASCGIQADDGPRDIGVDDRSLTPTDAADASEASGASRVYLVTPNESDAQRRLRSVQRDVQPRAAPLLEVLFDGPNTTEAGDGMSTALPAGLQLRSTRPVGDVLFVDVSEEMTELSGDLLILAVAQIVHTATEIDSVRAVRLRVEGQDLPWPRGDGKTATGALTVYDYPGVVESAQPAYPAIP